MTTTATPNYEGAIMIQNPITETAHVCFTAGPSCDRCGDNIALHVCNCSCDECADANYDEACDSLGY